MFALQKILFSINLVLRTIQFYKHILQIIRLKSYGKYDSLSAIRLKTFSFRYFFLKI